MQMTQPVHHGFTLVEMAVTLVILGLLLSSVLVPLGAQIDQRDYAQARSDLLEIREALIGYALINGILPCPDTTGDGIADSCPVMPSTSSSGGDVPWADLGVKPQDPWRQAYRYRVNGVFTIPFTLGKSATLQVCADASCGNSLVTGLPAIMFSAGKHAAVTTNSPDELENVDNDANFVNHDVSNVAGNEFDDVLVWISPNILFSRMVAASRLP